MIQLVTTNSAVLDLHFSPNTNSDKADQRFAVATSAGAIEIHSVASTTQPDVVATLKCIQVIQAYDPSLLILSLAFNPLAFPSEILAVTLSDGSVAVFDRSEDVRAHTLENWTVAWSSFVGDNGRQLLYTGGDDSMLRILSYSTGNASQKEPELLGSVSAEGTNDIGTSECGIAKLEGMCDRRSMCTEALHTKSSTPDKAPLKTTLELRTGVGFHGAGVTAILPINLGSEGNSQAEILLTGSYDEFIRVLSLGSNGRWILKAEKRLGGGVWRLKHLCRMKLLAELRSRQTILASCMHAGARIVEISHNADDTWSIAVFARFEEHESMNYASDFVKTKDVGSSREITTVVSTSFYDRKLCVTPVPDLA